MGAGLDLDTGSIIWASGGGGSSLPNTPNRLINTDASGNPDDTRLYSEESLLLGIIPSQEIGGVGVDNANILFFDASGVGYAQGVGVGMVEDETGAFIIVSNTGTTYLEGLKSDTNTFTFGVNPLGTGSAEYPFKITALGLTVDMEQDMSGNKIVNLLDPTNDQDAATKKYVDDNTGGSLVLADITDVTASAAEVNVLDGIPGTLTATELGYVDGVTSSIQTQLNGKVNDTGDTMTGDLVMDSVSIDFDRDDNTDITALFNFLTAGVAKWRIGQRISGSEDLVFHISGVGAVMRLHHATALTQITNKLQLDNLTADTVPYADSSKQLVSSNVTPTELGYLQNVTSDIQDQLNDRIDVNIVDAKGDLIVGTNNNAVDNLTIGSQKQVPVVDSTTTTGLAYETLRVEGSNFVGADNTSAIAETVPIWIALTNRATLTSGRLALCPIWLRKGTVVTSISFVSGTQAAVTPTNQWFALCKPQTPGSTTRDILAVTVDDTSNAWTQSTIKTLALTSPYTITSSGLYMLGIMVAAATVPSLRAVPASAGGVPAQSFNTTSGLTSPPSLPATTSTNAALGEYPYAYVT